MNIIVVFNKRSKINEANLIAKIGIPQEIDAVTELYLFTDEMNLADVQTKFQSQIQIKENIFFIVLHDSKQAGAKEDFKKIFGQNVITQSNIDGQFFQVILPKLSRSEAISIEEIKAFFPDQSLIARLRLLHKLLARECNLESNETLLIEQNDFPLEQFKKSTDENWERQALRNFRDQLIPS